MKKVSLVLSFIFILILTGCGKKVYLCQKNIINTTDRKIDNEITITVDNKKVTKETITIKYTTKNTESAKKGIENQYNKYLNENGINYYFEDLTEGFNFVIEVDLKKANKEIVKELELYSGSGKTVINAIQNDGYECIKK